MWSATKLNFRTCYFSILTILTSHPHIREAHCRMLWNFLPPAPVLARIPSTTPKHRQTPYHTSRQGHRPSHKRLCLIAPYFDVIVSSSTKTGVLFPKYIVQDSVHQFFIRFVGIWKPTFGCGKKNSVLLQKKERFKDTIEVIIIFLFYLLQLFSYFQLPLFQVRTCVSCVQVATPLSSGHGPSPPLPSYIWNLKLKFLVGLAYHVVWFPRWFYTRTSFPCLYYICLLARNYSINQEVFFGEDWGEKGGSGQLSGHFRTPPYGNRKLFLRASLKDLLPVF